MFAGPNEGVYQVHPFHMKVNKPRNINDADLSDDRVLLGQTCHTFSNVSA